MTASAGLGAPEDDFGRSSAARTFDLALLLLVVAVATLHLRTVYQPFVNFDEFRYLSDIYDFQRGTLNSALQTLHVHLFAWLPAYGGSEIDQVIAARFVYYLLLLGSCGFIYLIAKRFFSVTAALFVVLCYLAYAEVIAHATAFRYDGLSVFFLLGALAILLQARGSRGWLILAGALTAVALMVTVKSIFYLPTLALVAALGRHSAGWRLRVGELLLFLIALGACFAFLFALHKHSLPVTGLGDTVTLLQGAAEKQLLPKVLFPARQYILFTLLLNAIIWLFVLFGLAALFQALRRRDRRREICLLLSMLIPLGSLVFYRNAFPYFYVFLMPAVLIVCGMRFDEAREKLLRGRARGALLLFALMIAGALLNFSVNYALLGSPQPLAQRQVIEAVHRIFPEPVPYIDGYSMVASFPKVGFFMSTWGMENYRQAGVPIFPTLLRQQAPIFLIVNDPALVFDSTGVHDENTAQSSRLLDADLDVLRQNFIPHWGPIYVAGKRIGVSDVAIEGFEVLIPGPYTVEAKGGVIIDGTAYEPGDVVFLTQRSSSVQSRAGPQVVSLRWGIDLHRPADTPLPLRGAWASAVTR